MADKDKRDLQTRGVPDSVDRSGTLGEWLDDITKNPPKTNLKPGEATAMIRAMRDAIDRA